MKGSHDNMEFGSHKFRDELELELEAFPWPSLMGTIDILPKIDSV